MSHYLNAPQLPDNITFFLKSNLSIRYWMVQKFTLFEKTNIKDGKKED